MELLSDLSFAQKEYLYFLLILPLIYLFPLEQKTNDISEYNNFAEKRFLMFLSKNYAKKTNINFIKFIFIIISALFIIALAKPRGNLKEIELSSNQDKMIIVVDLSLSMNVNDIYPSRLKFVKTELANALENGNINADIAFMGFANIPYLLYPFTNDYETGKEIIAGLSTDLINVQGSNVTSAISQAAAISKLNNNNTIIIITDGSFDIPDHNIIKDMKLDDFNFHIISVATESGGPVIDKNGKFIKNSGKNVISKLEISKISDLKNILNAKLHAISNNNLDFIPIFNNLFNSSLDDKKQNIIKIWEEYFYIPVILTMLFMMIFFQRGFLSLILISIIFLPINNRAKASILLNQNQEALKNYQNKSYQKAEDLFEDNYNKGVSAYRNNNFEAATKYFSKDLNNEKSLFNLGNSQLLSKKIKQAIKNYEKILENNPNHQKAKKNLEIAKKLLKQQQENQNKDNKEQENNNQDKQENNDSDNNNSQNKQQEFDSRENESLNEEENNNDSRSSEESKDEKNDSNQNSENNILEMIESGTEKMLKDRIGREDNKNRKNLRQVNPW